MPTIYDIAKKAGVSPTTVSKVFNNYKDVSLKTKEKVLLVAKELGYVPNLTARSLRTDKSYLVGVVFSEDLGIGLEHQFFSVVLESFRKTIGTYGYDTIFINKTFGEQNIGYLDHCKYRNVDGVFIITALPDDIDFSKLIDSKIKCVTTDILFDESPYVISDNIAGIELGLDYLYQMGHRKIAHLSGPLNTVSGQQRNETFRKHIAKYGLLDESLIVEVEMYNYDDAYNCCIELLKNEEDRPTAIFAAADIMAIAAYQAIRDLNLDIPEDISVVGFDDIQLAGYANPGLTTIRQDKVKIGEKIAETLYLQMSKKVEKSDNVIVPVSLVIRESVKKI